MEIKWTPPCHTGDILYVREAWQDLCLPVISGEQPHDYTYKAGNEELLKKALRSKAKIMISGYDSDLYNDYLKGWQKEYFKGLMEYGSKRQEVVWMNYEQYRQNNIFDMLEE